jgi:hypothetical protein
MRRDPAANPLAPELEDHTPSSSPRSSPEPNVTVEMINGQREPSTRPGTEPPATPTESSPPADVKKSVEEADPASVLVADDRPQDWNDLPMLEKLDSLHLLTEWQFQNVNRFRSTMRSDDENASWVRSFYPYPAIYVHSCLKRIEPIGYDAKSNAYWLVAG